MPENLIDRETLKKYNLHLRLLEEPNKQLITEPLVSYNFNGGRAANEDGRFEAKVIQCTYHQAIDDKKEVIEFSQEGSSIQIPIEKLVLNPSAIAVTLEFKFEDNYLDRINLFEGSSVPFVLMLLKRDGKYYPAVSVNLSKSWYTLTAQKDMISSGEWCNLCGLFTGEELFIFKNNQCIARRVFKNAKLSSVGTQGFFIGTWIDGKRNQFKGVISSFELWDSVPCALLNEIGKAVNEGLGEIDSKYLSLGGESFLGQKVNGEQMIRRPLIRKGRSKGFKELENERNIEKQKLYSVLGKECEYTNGKIYWSKATGAYEVHGDILKRYKELNGPLGKLGFPRSDEINGRKPGSRVSAFENGAIYFSGSTGTHEIIDYIYAKYINLGGESSFLGLPISQEETLNGGIIAVFEGGRIYYSEKTGAHEVHGDILQRYLSFSIEERNSFGYPISDEMDILNSNGSTTGKKLSQFENATIYWSMETGAHIVYGAILKRYIELGGPLGKMGMPLTNEEGIPDINTRYNDFVNGVIVWKPEWGTRDIFNLQLRLGEVISGQIDDGYGYSGKDRSAELICYTTVSINGSIIDNGTRRPGGHAGDSYNINQVYQIPNIKHNTEVYFKVKIDDWDKVSDNDYLGSVEKTFTISTLWGLENGSYGIFSQQPLTHKGGDAYHYDSVKLSFSIALPDAPDPSKCFRDKYWWWYHNFSGPDELDRDFYANTFTDVEIIGDNVWEKILNPIDTLIYELAYKDICKAGNCFGMCLEALYTFNHSSLFTIPLSKYFNLNDTIRTIINRKHGYQVGADAVIWTIAKFLSGEVVLPKQLLGSVKSRIDREDYPIITMMSLSEGRGHAVLAYKYSNNKIFVADPNRPFNPSAVGGEDVGYIEIFDNNTFKFYNGSSIGYQTAETLGGLLPDTYLMEIPFHVLSSQPMTPGRMVLLGLLSILGGMLILAGDAECEQITCGTNNFYDHSTGRRRMKQTGVKGLIRLPLFDRSQNQPELYALQGEIPETLQFTLKGKSNGNYRKCISTYQNMLMVEAPIKTNETDTVLLEGSNTSRPAISVKTSGSPKDIRVGYTIIRDNKGKENTKYNINLQASKMESTIGVDSLGGSLIITQAGPRKPIVIEKEYVLNNQLMKSSITLIPEKENEIIKVTDYDHEQNVSSVLIEKFDSFTGKAFNRIIEKYK